MGTNYLAIKWTLSRARHSYGQPVVTLTDTATGKRYRCQSPGNAGAMVGTVLGAWLQATYQQRLLGLQARAAVRYSFRAERQDNNAPDALDALVASYDGRGTLTMRVDGTRGVAAVTALAQAIGLAARPVVANRQGYTDGMIIETAEATPA